MAYGIEIRRKGPELETAVGVLLAGWLAIGIPAAIALAAFDRPCVAIIAWLAGPLAWCAWMLAYRRHLEDEASACSQHFLSKV